MKQNYLSLKAFIASLAICSLPFFAISCSSKSDSGAKTEEAQEKADEKPGKACTTIDKSSDSTLQAMIKSVVPQFKQLEYTDAQTGKTLKYNLYTPANLDASKKYPLVLFTADASTAGGDITLPLTQGYGALVWATAESQAKNPCYVLVPQFSAVAVNDSYQKTDEVDMAARLLKSLVAEKNIDADRLYATGQSMGGMLSMYYNVAYPDLFAASIFVDSYCDTASVDSLIKHKFIYFIAGDQGKAYSCLEPLENAARKEGVQYTFAAWSAQLPESRQSELAQTMLEKGAPVNIFEFEPKTVLPADGEGCEHMYSFDYAYKINAVRDWLFKQSK